MKFMRSFLDLWVLATVLAACTSTPFNETAIPVVAIVETTPVASTDDAADDPAIWVNVENPEASLILGTDKRAGLVVYSLEGEIVQFLDRGRVNNVDIRQGVAGADGTVDLIVATNRTTMGFDIFTIDDSGWVRFAKTQPLDFVDPYGICMGTDNQGNAYAYVNDKTGAYQQWHLNPEGVLNPELVAGFNLETQPEGCVVLDSTQTLYVGEENKGIWKLPADLNRADERELIDQVGAGRLTADVEGMEIYEKDDTAWLVVSSQGDFSYAIYDLNDGDAYLGNIRIDDNIGLGIDGAQETDGLSVSSAFLGKNFEHGLLVVQDGFNKDILRGTDENQNFKLIPWVSIEEALVP